MTVFWRAIIYTILGSTGFLANIFIIIVLKMSKDLMTRESSKFIINQSAIDAVTSLILLLSYGNLVGNFNLPVTITYRDNYFFPELLCKVWNTDLLQWAFVKTSTLNLVILTVERHLKIVHPMWYKAKVGDKTIKGMLIAPWIIGPLYQIAFFIYTADVRDNKCKLSHWPSKMTSQMIGVVSFITQFFLPIIIMVYCYMRILNRIKKRWRKMEVYSVESVESSCGSMSTEEESVTITPQPNKESGNCHDMSKVNPADKRPCVSFNSNAPNTSHTQADVNKVMNRKIQKKVIQTLLIVSVAFFLCWVCNQVTFLLANIGVFHWMDMYGTPFYYFAGIAAYSNCCINPFIYMSQYKQFRNSLCVCFRR